MKRMLFLSALLVASGVAMAQQDRIEADRPSETVATQLVEKGRFQAELGFERETDDESHTYHHPHTLLRYGLGKIIELRAELWPQTVKDRFTEGSQTGLAPVEPGIKAKICESKGARPAISFLTQVGIPKLASEAFRNTYASPRVRLLFENKLNEDWKLTYNVGPEWTGEDTEPQWRYTFSPEWKFGKHWEAFAEVYGHLQHAHEPEHVFDAGLAFYPGRNIKLDLSGGVGLSHAAPQNFVALGFSIRTGN
ncbi:transporter [Flaviaesturariibacter flavus]|uniref:Transporter n=1 Tax=Flaviaesturariibacter flavus TaxID=2502780 RepID=A0A4R1B9Z1_9BACT|nr:transporter [Flaviaesturariibacter flavus]TCJ13734.1 transporter [Flaviaesturariibacter flavus]